MTQLSEAMNHGMQLKNTEWVQTVRKENNYAKLKHMFSNDCHFWKYQQMHVSGCAWWEGDDTQNGGCWWFLRRNLHEDEIEKLCHKTNSFSQNLSLFPWHSSPFPLFFSHQRRWSSHWPLMVMIHPISLPLNRFHEMLSFMICKMEIIILTWKL